MAKKGRLARLEARCRKERLAALKNQMEEAGLMFETFTKDNQVMKRLIRDNYAAHCVAASAFWDDKTWPAKKVATRAFDVADAMMAEREKRSK